MNTRDTITKLLEEIKNDRHLDVHDFETIMEATLKALPCNLREIKNEQIKEILEEHFDGKFYTEEEIDNMQQDSSDDAYGRGFEDGRGEGYDDGHKKGKEEALGEKEPLKRLMNEVDQLKAQCITERKAGRAEGSAEMKQRVLEFAKKRYQSMKNIHVFPLRKNILARIHQRKELREKMEHNKDREIAYAFFRVNGKKLSVEEHIEDEVDEDPFLAEEDTTEDESNDEVPF